MYGKTLNQFVFILVFAHYKKISKPYLTLERLSFLAPVGTVLWKSPSSVTSDPTSNFICEPNGHTAWKAYTKLIVDFWQKSNFESSFIFDI